MLPSRLVGKMPKEVALLSKLERLIAEFCPDGVELKSLWQVTIWDKKFNAVDRNKQPKVINYPYLLAAELFGLEKEDGNVFLLSTGEQTGWTTEELAGNNLCEGEVVTIPWGKSRPVKEVIKYYNGKFVTADNRIATSNDAAILLNKYLYYWLLSQGEVIDSFYRGSGIKHPSMKDVLDMQIPLPPKPVQLEIIRILDNFTELTAQLTAELTARKKQYEYYRDEVLTFDTSTRRIRLGDICTVITKGTTPKSYQPSGIAFVKTEAFDGSRIVPEKLSYVDEETHLGFLKRSILQANDILITIAGATIGKCAMIPADILPANTNQALAIIRLADGNSKKYVMHLLQSNIMKEYMQSNIKGSAQPNLNLKQLNDFVIPLPSVEEQERIVGILDRFDALCNDITNGLPAEIEARRKQYEYYRDKLLTFKEASA